MNHDCPLIKRCNRLREVLQGSIKGSRLVIKRIFVWLTWRVDPAMSWYKIFIPAGFVTLNRALVVCRTTKFFLLDGLLLFCIVMRLRSASSAKILLVFWSCYAPIFFLWILPFATPYPSTLTKFFCLLYWKYSPTKPKHNNYSKRFALNQLKIEFCAPRDIRNLRLVLCYFTCMYCPKLVIHSNQIKLPMASSVD